MTEVKLEEVIKKLKNKDKIKIGDIYLVGGIVKRGKTSHDVDVLLYPPFRVELERKLCKILGIKVEAYYSKPLDKCIKVGEIWLIIKNGFQK